MKHLVAILVVITIVNAKRRTVSHELSSDSSESQEPIGVFGQSPGVRGLDLKGTLKRHFAVEAALLTPESSVICSPLSALLPLGKLALGANSTTEKELLVAIGVRKRTKMKKKFKFLLQFLKALPGVRLDLISKIYLHTAFKLDPHFAERASKVFGSTVDKFDLNDPEETARVINIWMKEQTHGKIKHIVTPDMISGSTNTIIVNAVYFMGKWANPFKHSSPGKFYSREGEQTLTMMSNAGAYNYVKDSTLDAEIIEIPYEKSKASFIIVLPKEKDGLSILLRALKVAPELLNKALAKLELTSVKLTMPKFKIESQLDLKRLYYKIGVHELFSHVGGLQHMVQNTLVLVDSATQKAIIEVTETGTVAAAGTGVIMIPINEFIEDIELIVNHPFLFFIVADRQQLFTGTFVITERTHRTNYHSS